MIVFNSGLWRKGRSTGTQFQEKTRIIKIARIVFVPIYTVLCDRRKEHLADSRKLVIAEDIVIQLLVPNDEIAQLSALWFSVAVWFCQLQLAVLLLMAEILHHLGCMKPYK